MPKLGFQNGISCIYYDVLKMIIIIISLAPDKKQILWVQYQKISKFRFFDCFLEFWDFLFLNCIIVSKDFIITIRLRLLDHLIIKSYGQVTRFVVYFDIFLATLSMKRLDFYIFIFDEKKNLNKHEFKDDSSNFYEVVRFCF